MANETIKSGTKQKDEIKKESTATVTARSEQNSFGLIDLSFLGVVLITVTLTASICLVIFGLVLFSITSNPSQYKPDYDVDWVAEISAQIVAESKARPGIKKAEMKMAWQTPIYRMNLAKYGINITEFNTNLAVTILHEYSHLVNANQNKLVKNGYDLSGTNQAFYDWQMKKGGWDLMTRASPEIQHLHEVFQTATDSFLRNIGQDQTFIQTRSKAIQAWATVHESCIFHLPHTHPDQLVSGVYYVKMPDDAGSIIFEDPRGPFPPFSNRITIKPRQGDLILFPSWLTHQVAPTGGSETRISIPFNIEGNWEDTIEISATFPVD